MKNQKLFSMIFFIRILLIFRVIPDKPILSTPKIRRYKFPTHLIKHNTCGDRDIY